MALLALFGITLLFPELADRLTRPLVALGARLSQSADRTREHEARRSLPRSCSASRPGLLWAPCAGPVLGLILTGAALQGASVQDLAAAARLCGGRGDLARARPADRRTGLRRDEALARRRRMDPARAGRRGAGRPSPRSRLGLDTGFLTRVRSPARPRSNSAARQVPRLVDGRSQIADIRRS